MCSHRPDQPASPWAKVLGAAFLTLGLACSGGGSGPPPAPPAITSFHAAQPLLTAGQGTTLTAVFSGGTGTVDQGLGPISSGLPLATGILPADTTFTLTVLGTAGGNATAAALVKVFPAPTITSFTNSGPTSAGAGALLTAVFAHGAGVVNPGGLPITSGVPLLTAPLTATTTFTLGVTNPAGGAATATTTVTESSAMAALTLTVTGPAGATGPLVTVLGPAGYGHTATASGTLTGIPSGRYAIVPAGVWDAGQAYRASGAQSLILTAGATAQVTVTYASAATLTFAVPEAAKPTVTVPLTLVAVPAGTFQMGAYPNETDSFPQETPQHPVTLSRPFYLAKYLTTQAQWLAVMGSDPSDFVQGDALTLPVEQVSWNTVAMFLGRLNTATAGQRPAGMAFRLPTEAEWEYACRAGTGTRFFWGDDPLYGSLGRYAWWSGNSGAAPHGVGSLGPASANPFGLFDLPGDLWEWCQDWYGLYAAGAQTDPTGPASGTFRVVRGGSWFHGSLYCRAANRSYSGPNDAFSSIGFRVVLAPVGTP